MARIARVVVPGIAHHVIQRGNRRQRVFFNDSDKQFYLNLLTRIRDRAGLTFVSYCLMDNHVHLVVIPLYPDSLARGLAETHRTYTSVINAREDWKGYLWQGRFLSFPMDEAHTYLALRYVECNPVRAGMVKKAEDYPWSSAAFHSFGHRDIVVRSPAPDFGISDWSGFLSQGCDETELRTFRKHSRTGRPLGGGAFLSKLEEITGRGLVRRKPGRRPSIK